MYFLRSESNARYDGVMLEVGNDDSALVPYVLDDLRHRLKCLLWDGAIWLHESRGSLTHCCLRAIEGTSIFFPGDRHSGNVANLAWPAPGSLERYAPIKRAQGFYILFDGFFCTMCPDHEDHNFFAAFDLGSTC
jgi:hypothetical protein